MDDLFGIALVVIVIIGYMVKTAFHNKQNEKKEQAKQNQQNNPQTRVEETKHESFSEKIQRQIIEMSELKSEPKPVVVQKPVEEPVYDSRVTKSGSMDYVESPVSLDRDRALVSSTYDSSLTFRSDTGGFSILQSSAEGLFVEKKEVNATFTKAELVNGIILSEILGPPKSKLGKI